MKTEQRRLSGPIQADEKRLQDIDAIKLLKFLKLKIDADAVREIYHSHSYGCQCCSCKTFLEYLDARDVLKKRKHKPSRKLSKAMKEINRELDRQIEELRQSEQITEKDLQVIINAR